MVRLLRLIDMKSNYRWWVAYLKVVLGWHSTSPTCNESGCSFQHIWPSPRNFSGATCTCDTRGSLSGLHVIQMVMLVPEDSLSNGIAAVLTVKEFDPILAALRV